MAESDTTPVEEAWSIGERDLRAIVEQCSIVFWVSSVDRRKAYYVSPVFERVFGFPRERVYEDAAVFLDVIHPDDRESFLRTSSDPESSELRRTFRIIRPDGEVRWVRDRAFPLRDGDGEVRRLGGFTEDVTERERVKRALRGSERFIRHIAEASPHILYVFNVPEQAVVYANRHIMRDLGYSPEEIAAMGSEFLPNLMHPDDLARLPDLVARWGAAADGEVLETEVSMRHGNGEWRRFLGRDTVFERDAQGRVKLVIGTAQDITARRRAEAALYERERREKEIVQDQLEQVRDELIRTTRLAAVGQVSAQIAHDLRNPLSTIQNAAYYLKRSVLRDVPRSEEYLTLIENEVQACDRIIGNLLEVTRPKEPVRSEASLDKLIEDALTRLQAPDSVTFHFECDEVPFLVQVDPVQWRQVIDNLLDNALHAIGTAGEITVSLVRDGDDAVMTVRDSGPGVSPDVREHIFELLYTTKSRGTGLGLAICRQIVERHGGSIDLVDDDRAGATFRILLPLATTDDAADR